MSDWPEGLTIRPISHWPGQLTRVRSASPFNAALGATLTLLQRELDMLNARDIVMEIAVTEGDIRIDGRPHADARPAHPGVILTFEARKRRADGTVGAEPLRFACDRFLRWPANLRAVALGLEALRKIDRYGIAQSGEQYRGWKALPAGDAPMSAEEARRVLDGYGGEHEALLATHPDRGHTDLAAFRRVLRAREALRGAAARG